MAENNVTHAACAVEVTTLATQLANLLHNAQALLALAADSLPAVPDADPDADNLIAATRAVVSQGGWCADLILERLEGGQVVGGAAEWLLPPSYHAAHGVVRQVQERVHG